MNHRKIISMSYKQFKLTNSVGKAKLCNYTVNTDYELTLSFSSISMKVYQGALLVNYHFSLPMPSGIGYHDYYSILVNEGICPVIVIQTLYPSHLSVLYIKPNLFYYHSLFFLFIVYKSYYAIWNTLIWFLHSMLFCFTDIIVYMYLYTLLCVYIIYIITIIFWVLSIYLL